MSSHRLLDLYSGARDLSAPEFGELGFRLVRDVLPIHSGMFGHGRFHADGKATIFSLHRYNVSAERLFERGSRPGGDPAILNSLANAGRAVHTDARAHAEDDPDLLAYLQRYEVWHAFTLSPTSPLGRVTEGVTLWSGRLRRGLSMSELIGQANEVLPHLLLANSINRRVDSGAPGPACAVAAHDCVLLSSSDSARALLAVAWPDWHPPQLPAELVAGLLAHGWVEVRGVSVTATMVDDLLMLRLCARAAPVLSAAEQRVAVLAVGGATYKEIARECGVSPATVRNQLHAAYAKLGVRNKTALARALAGS